MKYLILKINCSSSIQEKFSCIEITSDACPMEGRVSILQEHKIRK
jgi:hypothetical protein